MSSFRPTDDLLSWGGTLRAEHHVARPVWRDELPQLLTEAKDGARQVLACGLRRSYGDSGLNPDGVMIDMSGADRLIEFDFANRLVRAEGGAPFDRILSVCVRHRLFLPVTPGTRFVTLAGAIANDVHGKNHAVNGTIGNWVRRIGLLTSDGREHVLSSQSEPELFAATIGGLGLTGLITWAELELIPVSSALMNVEKVPFGNLGEFFQIASESQDGFDYTVSWIDCLASGPQMGRGIFERANHAPRGTILPDLGEPLITIPFHLPGFLLNSLSIKAFNWLYYNNGVRKQGAATSPIVPFFYPLDSIGKWNRMYGRRGMYQYQSVVPPECQFDATAEMLKAIAQSGQGSFLAVLKTFGDKPSAGMLSFPIAGTTLALDFPNRGESTLKLLGRLDAIVREARGRLYPAKDGRMSAEMFQSGYPVWSRFAEFVDPGFTSHFWKRVSQ